MAETLYGLSALYLAQSAYNKAEPILQRVLRIREQAFAEDHPDIVATIFSLALLFWAVDDASRAHECFARAFSLRECHTGRVITTLPEPRRRQFLEAQHDEQDALISFHTDRAPGDSQVLALSLTAVLRRKGRLFEEVMREQTALRRSLSPTLQGEIDALQSQRARLAATRFATLDLHCADRVAALEQDVDRREAALSRKSAAYRGHAESITIEAVQSALRGTAALIEFVRYRQFDARRQEWTESRYVAYVLPPRGAPQWLMLGKTEPIEAAIKAVRSVLTRPECEDRDPLRALDELVFAPIRRMLGSIAHYLLSPDAALHLMPFAALVDEGGRYLVERMHITYLGGGRDLVRSTCERGPSRPLVVAAPDYGGYSTPLPGAEAEANAIQRHFADVELHTGRQATKGKLTTTRAPLFVHIATHGFVRPSRPQAFRAHRLWRDERDVSAPGMPAPDDRLNVEDALDDAGLIFAGANDADAILTAREIAALDLAGTQLVVLSACDTGIGQVAQGEGVYGLRRAFAIAGAETQVVSLWKVDDEATSTLMDRYYGGLRSGGGRSEALRDAQLAALRNGPLAHPFYWAAFVPVGDERPLRFPSELPSCAER